MCLFLLSYLQSILIINFMQLISQRLQLYCSNHSEITITRVLWMIDYGSLGQIFFYSSFIHSFARFYGSLRGKHFTRKRKKWVKQRAFVESCDQDDEISIKSHVAGARNETQFKTTTKTMQYTILITPILIIIFQMNNKMERAKNDCSLPTHIWKYS